MSKLVPPSMFRDWYKGLFEFRREFDQIYRSLINWPFSEAPPAGS